MSTTSVALAPGVSWRSTCNEVGDGGGVSIRISSTGDWGGDVDM
jgi:hypothetical protein